MSYRLLLPSASGTGTALASEPRLDMVDAGSSAVQRQLRRVGIGGYETPTMATLLALAERGGRDLTFFDVGANVGLYAAMIARLFQPAAVVAFEPAPTTAAMARRIASANRLPIRVEEIALGEEAGTAKLFLSARSDASNSLAEGFKENVGTVDVRVDRLDAYVERTGVIPTLMKVDTESFEPQVVNGGRRTLLEHRPSLVIEVLNRRGHDHGEELTAAMSGLGYHYYRIEDGLPWMESATIQGNRKTPNHDWLLTPEPLDPGFGTDVDRWREALSRCTADTNPRIPVTATARAIVRSEGWPALARAGRNKVRNVVRGRRRQA